MPEACPPSALRIIVDAVPVELKTRPQWVAWRYELRDGKWTKVLKNPSTGYNGKSDNPATWGTFETALAGYRRRHMDGIGFVFSADDPYAGVDLDRCRDPITGTIAPWALAIIEALQSYTEISPSGTGVKIFVGATIPPGGHRKDRIEMYDRGRYFTVTAHHLAGTPLTVEERQAEIDALHAQIFQPERLTPRPAQASPHTGLDINDDALIARALMACNGRHFAQLWAGDSDGYASHSEADAALCALLAFWCGPDADRIDRLFRRSERYREKWDARHYGDGRTYGQATIAHATSGARVFYNSDRLQQPTHAPIRAGGCVGYAPPPRLSGLYRPTNARMSRHTAGEGRYV